MDDAVIRVRDLRMRYGTKDVLDGVEFDVHRGEVVTLLGPNGAGKTTTIEILEGFRERSGGDVTVLGEDPLVAPEPWRAGIGIVGRPEILFLDEPTAGFDPEARRDFHDIVHGLVDRDDTTIVLTTHDLDEAEKLADRILILAGGRIVADGSAEQLARRVQGKAQVTWTVGGERFVHAADDATAFVRSLFAQYGDAVADLEVRRTNLEDTYMSLVRRHEFGEGLDTAPRGRADAPTGTRTEGALP